MSKAKMADIARRLLDMSQEGKVNWSTTVDENRFIVAFPDYSVSITRTASPSYGKENYILAVHNERGTEIEYLRTDQGFLGNFPIVTDPTGLTLRDLFEAARRSALKPEKVLDDLLARLSSKP